MKLSTRELVSFFSLQVCRMWNLIILLHTKCCQLILLEHKMYYKKGAEFKCYWKLEQVSDSLIIEVEKCWLTTELDFLGGPAGWCTLLLKNAMSSTKWKWTNWRISAHLWYKTYWASLIKHSILNLFPGIDIRVPGLNFYIWLHVSKSENKIY